MFMVYILTFLAIFMGISTIFSSFIGCFKKKKNPSSKNQQQQSKEPILPSQQQLQQPGDGGGGPPNIENIYVDGDPKSAKALADGGSDTGFHDHDDKEKSKHQQIPKPTEKNKPTLKKSAEPQKKSAESGRGKKRSNEAIGGGGSHESGPGDNNHSKDGVGKKSKESAKKKNDEREEKAKKGLIVRRQCDYPAMNDNDISDFDEDSSKKKSSFNQQSLKQQSQRSQKKVVGKTKRKNADDKSHK